MVPAAQPLETLFGELRQLVESPEFPAVRQWREEHPAGRIVGHFQVYFPEELADAAGCLPLKLAGGGAALPVRRADALVAAFACSIVRTSLELVLSQRLDLLNLLFVPNICDAARNSCGIWGRNFPDLRVETLYLPQNAASTHSVDFLEQEYRRIGRLIEQEADRTIGDQVLRASIERFNENRRLLRQLYRLRRESPWLISAVESYLLVRSAGLMPRERHNELLHSVLEQLPDRQARKQDRIRVVFHGGFCEQPPLDMLAVIQNSCYIVDDDWMIGLRWLSEDVPLEGDPWRNLAWSYLERSDVSPVQRDPRKPRADRLLERVRAARAEAVILAAAKMCEPGLEEQTRLSHALDRAGIPHLVLEFEETMTVFEQLGMEVETFAESLLFDFH